MQLDGYILHPDGYRQIWVSVAVVRASQAGGPQFEPHCSTGPYSVIFFSHKSTTMGKLVRCRKMNKKTQFIIDLSFSSPTHTHIIFALLENYIHVKYPLILRTYK